LEKSGFTKLQ